MIRSTFVLLKYYLINERKCVLEFKTTSAAVLNLIKHVSRVYETSSKTMFNIGAIMVIT